MNFNPSPYICSQLLQNIIFIDPLERSSDLHVVNTIDYKIKEFIRREEDIEKFKKLYIWMSTSPPPRENLLLKKKIFPKVQWSFFNVLVTLQSSVEIGCWTLNYFFSFIWNSYNIFFQKTFVEQNSRVSGILFPRFFLLIPLPLVASSSFSYNSGHCMAITDHNLKHSCLNCKNMCIIYQRDLMSVWREAS